VPLNDPPLPTNLVDGAPAHTSVHNATNTRVNLVAAAVDGHEVDTTNVHGIPDTTVLVTTSALTSGLAGKLDTSAAPELIRDTMGAALAAGTNVTITANDPGDTITIAATGGGAAGAVYGQVPRSGGYLAALTLTPGTAALVAQQARCTEVVLSATATADRIGIEVTAGGAGSTIGLAIYNSDSTGMPGTLVLDAGTVDASTTGFKEIAISQILGAGTYWLAALYVTGTAPTVRQSQNFPARSSAFAQSDLQGVIHSVIRGSLSSFPSPFPGSSTGTAGPRVYLRFA